ncbi:hypothetical protein [Shinella sp.]|uniref:hypothetical protein n=1 Tax=Shinella sp. TaxID=1870904 RepID=UPI003F712F86
MSIADMVPGHEYEPDLTIIEIRSPPVLGERGNQGVIFRMPVWLPSHYREPTLFNIQFALDLIEQTNPEASAAIERLKVLARHPNSRAFAAGKRGAAFQGKAGAH